MKIGIIREGKNPPDMRVPLSPEQCSVINKRDNVEVVVQSSSIRKFTDTEYENVGVQVVDSLEDCDVVLGVKEVPINMLIPHKTYFFFSHTIKEQPYNRDLLRAILDKKIQLVDYEVLTASRGNRLIGFGRYAGIVGCYNGFLAYGKSTQTFDLKPANQCADRAEMEAELSKIKLPNDFKIVLTGSGRVGGGAVEILDKLGLKHVEPSAFSEIHSEPVWTQLNVEDYNARLDGQPLERQSFYKDPTGCKSIFNVFSAVADMYIACHFWDADAPKIFSREDVKSENWNIKVVADISCDIDGPVASTIRPSTIEDPIYGYHRFEEKEVSFMDPDAITVMAVDNLPCELPKDASADFGSEFINKILEPLLGNDPENIIDRASITNKEGLLTSSFSYLQDYVDGEIA